MKYVIVYDNGSGYKEWACTPQDTPESAWDASGLKNADGSIRTVAGYMPEVEEVADDV